MKNAKQFMDKDFLLETETARRLFAAAEKEPIFDYHCHLNPAQIAENKKFDNLTDIWLGGDHYKWRMMRAFGIEENCITGNAAPFDKFTAWARTVENLIGNPLYHWTHLELQRYFDIYEPLTVKTAEKIWKQGNEKLKTDALSVKGILSTFNVYAVGTTDDPADSLEYHRLIAEGKAPIGKIATKVIPSFRPDKALNIDKEGFAAYIAKLSEAAGIPINNVADVAQALKIRLDFFVSLGCRASDHALETPPFVLMDETKINEAFKKALSGESVSAHEADAWKTRLLCALSLFYAERDVVMQLHLAALRNASERHLKLLGPDTGNDVVHDLEIARPLASLFSYMEKTGPLPKTILYSLNPKDYYSLTTIMGCFQDNVTKDGGTKGKFQLGSAWWFCDHRDGMEEQMRILGNLGMLSLFVGMLTDSRSFLSYPRHEYFRRILCNLLGNWVENGEYPADEEKLIEIARNISFGNAKVYFG
ncbi:uronate isomerase [Spirochaetia bacterium]|nr:uronate isomerase [Spirochaetia bacterium]